MKLFYLLLLVLCMSCVQQPKKIALQPYQGIKKEHVQLVRKSIEEHYHYEVQVLEEIELPKTAFINIKSPRYRADSLIRMLRRNKSNAFDHIIGLTHRDISITKYDDRSQKTIKKPEYKYKDFGIFGLGFRPGPSCVVSTFRLYSGKVSEAKMQDRLRKIALHELGHNLGLPHCSNKGCLMNDANESIKTIDEEVGIFCKDCGERI